MSYSEELKLFALTHTYEDIIVDGSKFHYVLSGKKDGRTLVMLNGGMNTLEMWMRYVDALSDEYQVLLFDYPQELCTNHDEVGGLILVSTGGMDAATIKSLKKKYFFAPLMLFYMKHCNYEKLKPTLIKAGMGHIRDESEEQAAYAQDMFETIFKDYKKEKDVHISGLLADLMNQTPVTADDFKKSGFLLRSDAKGSY